MIVEAITPVGCTVPAHHSHVSANGRSLGLVAERCAGTAHPTPRYSHHPEGSTRTSGWVQSALPMGEVRALPGKPGGALGSVVVIFRIIFIF